MTVIEGSNSEYIIRLKRIDTELTHIIENLNVKADKDKSAKDLLIGTHDLIMSALTLLD